MVVDAAWRAAAQVPGRYRRGGVGRYSPVANFAMTTNMATCIVPWIATTPTNQRILCVPKIRFGVDGASGRGKLHPDDRSVQADSRYPGFALQGESNAGSGKPGLAATGQCASPANAQATAPQTIRIVFYLFGSIAGFRPSLRWLRLSGRRPSFAGTVLGFGLIGQIWLQDDDDGEDYGPILLTEQATKLCRVGWTISGAVRAARQS